MLSKKEITTFVSLAKKLRAPKKNLPQAVFDALVKIVTFPACEMVILNSKGEILLTPRFDQHWQGWHFPGGLIRYNESFERSLRQTAKRELGVTLKSYKFLFPINYLEGKGNPRGHNVSLVFLCRISGPPSDGQWFKTMPRDIISEHRKLWRQASKALESKSRL